MPVWEWFFYKNNDLTNERQLSNTGRFQILGDGTLIVNGVSAQDIGLYKCHVISAGGNDSRIASLQVIGGSEGVPSSEFEGLFVVNVGLNYGIFACGELLVSFWGLPVVTSCLAIGKLVEVTSGE